MEKQKIQAKLTTARKSAKNHLERLFTERKSNKCIPQGNKKQIIKMNHIIVQRQSPITFLQSIQDNHKQIQKNLQQSHLSNSKWRSYNSPVQTPKFQSKQNILIQTLYSKRKQINSIKVYNHIYNEQQISTKNFQQPEFLDFIQEAVTKSRKQNVQLTSSNKKLQKIKKGFEIKQNYALGDQRKQILNLQAWIKSKVQSYEKSQTQGQTMFIQRINFLNMAFSEISRIAGTFSSQTKNIIDYLHKKYYEYYNFLTQCMIQQNKKIKSQISIIQDRLCKTINYYEEKLQKIKTENTQKSQKIVQNFHKCIQVRKKLQKQNKQLKRNFNKEKKKVKLMQEGLIKVITLFLTLGQKNIQQMTFTLQDPFEQNLSFSMLAKSKKHILTEQQRQMEKRKAIFQQWCGYLIKMIHRIVVKDIGQKQPDNLKDTILKTQAFEIIQRYMVQNDGSLSMADAEKILNNFLTSQQQEIKLKQELKTASTANKNVKQKELRNLQTLNRKFETMYSDISYQLPTFQEVYNKILIHDVDVQVNIKNQTQNWAVQTYVETIQTGIMAGPKTKTREVDASYNTKQKIRMDSGVYEFAQVFKLKKQKVIKRLQKFQEKQSSSHFDNKNLSYDNNIQNLRNSDFSSGSDNLENEQNTAKRKDRRKLNINTLIEVIIIDELTNQVGLNTDPFQMRNKKKTVQFSLPQGQNISQNQRNTISSMDFSNDKQSTEKQITTNNENQYFKEADSVRQIQSRSDALSNASQNKKQFRGRRKNGFLITSDKKKTHLSQRFIPNQSEQSIVSNISIQSDQQDQQATTPLLTKRQTSLSSQIQSQSNNRVSLEKNDYLRNKSSLGEKQNSANKKTYKTFEQKIAFNRSFFNLPNIQYASKQDADCHRIKDHVIRVPKKKTIRQRCLIDFHDFHLQLAFKNHEKLKFLSSITLWHPKLMFEMKKIRHRVNNLKPLPEINNKSTNLIKGYFTHVVIPILKDFLKSYCQQLNNDKFDFGDSLLSSSFKGVKKGLIEKQLNQSTNGLDKSKSSSNLLTYYHRLSPLLYNIINFAQYNQNRTSADSQLYFSGMKTLKHQSTKMEIYNTLIDGGCAQVDIFVKSIYHFNLVLSSSSNYDPVLSYFILEQALSQILEGYFNNNQIKKIVSEAKNFIIFFQDTPNLFRRTSQKSEARRDSVTVKHSGSQSNKSLSNDSKISFFQLLKIVYKTLKQKQQTQFKKYSIINEIISRNCECTSYEDIMSLLECLPIQNEKKRNILNQSLRHITYWQKSEAMISNDILFFILDRHQLYASNNNNPNVSVIKQYIINRCELYFKATLQRVTKTPEWVLNSTYILSYKIPKLFHRILYQIKTGRNIKQKKLLLCLLTQIFCNLIDNQMDKRYMPSLFNGLISIPNV